MDRFSIKFSLGYVDAGQEVAVLSSQTERHPLEALKPCATLGDIIRLRLSVSQVRISDEIKRYIVDIVRETRTMPGVQMGGSPRASLALMKSTQALALMDGREFVTPEQVRELAVPVIAHRLVLDPQARYSGVMAETIVEEILHTIPVPA